MFFVTKSVCKLINYILIIKDPFISYKMRYLRLLLQKFWKNHFWHNSLALSHSAPPYYRHGQFIATLDIEFEF